ncbi:apolipoprotein N-acyltransferase [Sphingomonas sp.]|uniref:apolipoprotein N-acyltransferase n=1 Tax=Sphingomonas sp. TaxID=28214 RepID=UPI0025F18A7D|nr:apolipoprotein N-acyltransferase [Sphingomonas sp.]MBV9528845.1 apolipoprotein N-acyltransferase [Sphingomonas sp.]
MLFLIALIAGAVSAFAFAPTGLWPLMPLAIAALCELVSRSRGLRQSLAIGWAFGLGQFCVGLNWIQFAFTFQDKMPHWLGYLAVLLLSLYLAVYPMLAAGLAWRCKGRPVALVLALAGSWAITEWLRATMFTGFAWNPIGVVLDDTDLLHTAAYIGTYGLSALVVLGGGLLWLFCHQAWKSGLAVSAAILLLHFPPVPPLAAATGKQIRVVQPNIGEQDKWTPGFGDISAQRLARLSARPGGQRPRLLLWPEAAVTDPLEDARTDQHQAFADFERTRATALVGPGEDLLTGGIALFSRDGMFIDGAANSIFVLGPGGREVARYDKAHLVPYGEYLPMRPLLSAIGLSRLAPGDVDFTSGPGPRTVVIPGWGKVGFQLCYEIIFSGEVVDSHNRPDFIFNPSNDAWFGRWGPPQHLAQARLRAAEEGLPVIRSTPTGISAVVDAHGEIVKSLPWRTAGVIDASLPPPAAAPTVFARFGNVIPLLLGFALLIGGIVLGVRRR